MKTLLSKLKSYAQTPGPRAKVLLGIATLIALLLLSLAIALLTRPDTASDVSSTETSQPQTAQITITKDGFNPATLSIKKGTKITWTNSDDKPHQLQANPHPTGDSLPGLKSEILNNQQTYEYTADTPGSYGYHDQLNPTINGTLEVQE